MLAPAAAFLVGAAATIAPATIRNYAVAREFVAISANAGINLHFGNHEFADGYSASSPEVGAWSCFDYPRIVRDLERREGRPLGYSGASAVFARMAARYAREHPGHVARLLARKTALFWGPAEIGNNKEYYYDRLNSRILRLPGFQENGQFVGYERYKQILDMQRPPMRPADFWSSRKRNRSSVRSSRAGP